MGRGAAGLFRGHGQILVTEKKTNMQMDKVGQRLQHHSYSLAAFVVMENAFDLVCCLIQCRLVRFRINK